MSHSRSIIVVLDQGTSSTRAIAFDEDGDVRAEHSIPTESFHPFAGAVEQDPLQIFNNSISCLEHVTEQLDRASVCGIAITNQRESAVVWERNTGEPVHHAIIWNDTRTANICERIAKDHEDHFHQTTGLTVSPYFSASKVNWIIESDEGIKAKSKAGKLAFGTIDSWLLYKFTSRHITEISNASRTLLYDIHKCSFSTENASIFGIHESILPEVLDSDADFGQVSLNGHSFPILAVLGDQQASLFGHGCFAQGDAKSTFGTGNFYMANSGNKVLESDDGLVSTIAWKKNNTLTYAQEGSVFYAGALIQWLKSDLGLFNQWSELEAFITTQAYDQSVWLIPAFSGLGSPWWDATVKAAIVGMKQGADRQQIINAAFHAVAHQSADLLSASTNAIKRLQIDGGMAGNKKFAQLLANITGLSVSVPKNLEMTAFGVARLAFEKLGIANDIDDTQSNSLYFPQWDGKYLEQIRNEWMRVVQTLINSNF